MTYGLWWEEVPKGTKKAKPFAFWNEPDYLPGLQEALLFPVVLMTDADILAESAAGNTLILDVECYINYFQVAFRSVETGKVINIERMNAGTLDIKKLKWILENFLTVSFNGIHFDIPILALALAGVSNAALKACVGEIIEDSVRPADILKRFRVKNLQLNHIDIKPVCPLDHSLKKYGSRLHTRKMQDLPFHPSTTLSYEQIAIVRFYCCNDLQVTYELFQGLQSQLSLRVDMSQQYGVDLRSKSDAQIAETVIGHELERLTGTRAKRPTIPVGTVYKYKGPDFISFQTPFMQQLYQRILAYDFMVNEKGSIDLPEFLKTMKIKLGNGTYTMGIGGLHSNEKNQTIKVLKDWFLRDADVASMYPSIILLLKLFPAHLGEAFLAVYQSIVDRRLEAKGKQKTDKNREAEWKIINESLKIVINGSFGKLGSKWSIFYAPDLMITVTLTGQLSLLMLIEQFELHGISAVSANTDGVVASFSAEKEWLYTEICEWWQKLTGMELEFAEYSALYSRDVNSYVAVKKKDGSAKCKGAFSNPWNEGNLNDQLKKSPTGTICQEAVIAYLLKGTPVIDTIKSCTDIKKFVFVKEVSGGGFKDKFHVGKVTRWVFMEGEEGVIQYCKNGNKVPGSDGAVPMMELIDFIPAGIDYQRYVNIVEGMLCDLGHPEFSGVNASSWWNLVNGDDMEAENEEEYVLAA